MHTCLSVLNSLKYIHTDVRDIIPRRVNAYLLTGKKRNINSAEQTCKMLCQAVKTL